MLGLKGLIFWLAILASQGRDAYAAPDHRLIELGAGLHFGIGRAGYEGSSHWLKDAGFTSFRDEIFWGDMERSLGKFLLEGRAQKSYENYMAALDMGMRPLLILNYGNKLYGDGHPVTSHSREAFTRYVIDVLKRFPSDMPYVELWNEWNIGAGTNPKVRYGDVDDYLALARVVVPEIRRLHPKSKILLGSLGDDLGGWPWLNLAVDKNILAYADGISVHLYNHSFKKPNGGAYELFERLQSLQILLRSRNGGFPFPIYVTETGYPNSRSDLSEQESSEQLIAFLLSLKLIEDVKGVWIYEWKDGGKDPLDREDNFGILRFDKSEKSLACRLRQFSHLIRFGKLISSKIDRLGIAFVIEHEGVHYFFGMPKLWGKAARPTLFNIFGSDLQAQPLSAGGCQDDLTEVDNFKTNKSGISVTLPGKPTIFRISGKVSYYSINLAPSL